MGGMMDGERRKCVTYSTVRALLLSLALSVISESVDAFSFHVRVIFALGFIWKVSQSGILEVVSFLEVFSRGRFSWMLRRLPLASPKQISGS